MRVLGILFYCLPRSLCVADWALLYLGPKTASAPKHYIHCKSSSQQSLIITNFFPFPLIPIHHLFILVGCRNWPYTKITNPVATSHSEKALRAFNEVVDIREAYAWDRNRVDRSRVFCSSSLPECDLIRTLNRYSGLLCDCQWASVWYPWWPNGGLKTHGQRNPDALVRALLS